MNTPLSWLKDYVPDLVTEDKEFAERMTMSGTKVESFERKDADLENIVVGEIVSTEKHPDSDHLIICQVNVGKETVQIVTGAGNVYAGAKVPVVLDGGRVAGGHDGTVTKGGIKIKKGKLRGVESFGMMCSIEELGSTRDFYPEAPENGIYIFEEEVTPGEDAIAALGLRDTVFEYEITSNRVDCYAILGIAREVAATYNVPFKPPVVKETGKDGDVNEMIKVSIMDKDLCTRYTARVLKDVKIAPSPKWMQRRLSAAGIRPINNIVDITNFVMLEYGQPMHAYDLSTINGNEIIVRRAKDGETYVTLDDQERTLDSDILMICDANGPVGIAGIMGGANSMITDNVKDVLFEAATFDGTNIRKSAKRLGMRTDASSIFEKGLDPNNALDAMNRACELAEELNAGTVVKGVVDVYENKVGEKRLPFLPEKYNALLGTNISKEQMLEYFKPLEVVLDEKTNELVIPTFRQDLNCQADIAEEVARFFGYDNIPMTLPATVSEGGLPFKIKVEKLAREVAEFSGFSQAYAYSFESPKVFDKLLLDADDKLRKTVVISNPLGEDFSVMRTVSLNGILNSLSTNYNRRNPNVKLYEMGNVYLPNEDSTKLPEERMTMTLGFYGEGDFYSLKGVVEEFLTQAGLKEKIGYNPNANKNFLHPGRQADIMYNDVCLGYLGEVHPIVLENYDIKDRVYVAVLDMPEIVKLANFDKKYEGIANFPAVTRDISILVPKTVLAGEVEDVIVKNAGKNLESYNLFDIYEGAQVGLGFKSMAYTITFRAKDRTLEEKEISASMDKIVNALKDKGITLRG